MSFTQDASTKKTTSAQNAAQGATPATGSSARSTVTISTPSTLGMGGLGSVISLLLLFAAWCVVGIAYICVPGSLVGGVLGVIAAAMNFGGNFASVALCLGCGIACFGLCVPFFVGARFGQHMLLKKVEPFSFQKNALVVCAAIAIIGACIAGLGALLGGGDGVALPAFLQTIFTSGSAQ